MGGFTKIIESGTLLETYEYEKPLPCQKIRKYVPKKPESDITRSYRRRRTDNVARLRKSFVRLVRANLIGDERPSLLTLTMREIVSIESAYGTFSKFNERFRYHFGKAIRYIAVPEFQKRGAVHFHVLIWGLSQETIRNERKTRTIANLWGQGFVDIITTDGHPKLASYLGKYMSKAVYDKRLALQKAYVGSRNVLRPVSLSNSLAFEYQDMIWGVGDNPPSHQRVFMTQWLGRCVYKRYNEIKKDESNTYKESSHLREG